MNILYPSYVDVFCPKCHQKAIFQSNWFGSYKLHIEKNGKVSCLNCGYNKEHIFNKDDYFYQIEVGKRKLYARDLKSLIILRNYFNERKHKIEPSLDFPKIFYLKRKEIIKKIDIFLKIK